MKPGRNDPCPCGSGRKHKHCCIAAEREAPRSPAEITWARVRRANEDFPGRMSTFVAETYGIEAVDEAWAEFMLWERERFDAESPLTPIFLPWLYHRWCPEPAEDAPVTDVSLCARPPTAVYLERRGTRLDPLQRRYLESCLESPFSFFEIVRADAGHGFLARDVITHEEHEVLERSASATMRAGEILFGQLVAIDGIVLLEACSPYPLPPAAKLPLIDLRERIIQQPKQAPSPRQLLYEWEFELREEYLDAVTAMLNPTPPVLHNTDGELVLPQRLTFTIDSAEQAVAALKDLAGGASEEELLEDAARDADGRLLQVEFAWMRAGNRMHADWENTILGHIEITADRLQVDVNSTERGEAIRAIVERALGSAARFVGSELPPRAAAADAADTDDDLSQRPEVRAHLNELIGAHYESWTTQEIPALGHRRPVDAVQSPEGREKVEALVRQMERDSRRMQPAPDPAIFTRLRERLGL